MQGKGIVKFFTWVFITVIAYQFVLMWPVNSVENDARSKAEEDVEALTFATETDKEEEIDRLTQYYLDSVSEKNVFSIGIKDYKYNELKKQQLALGLDLQGGMSVVLQVNLEDLIRALADNSPDVNIAEALSEAKKAQESDQRDLVTLFIEKYKTKKGAKLAAIFHSQLEGINPDAADDAVQNAIRKEATETVKRTYNNLKRRIDGLGVTQPNVFLDESTDRITVELPGVRSPKRAAKMLITTANLEFWEVYLNSEPMDGGPVAVERFINADESLRTAMGDGSSTTMKITYDTSYTDSTNTVIAYIDTIKTEVVAERDSNDKGPLFKLFQPLGFNKDNRGLAQVGVARLKDTAAVSALLRNPAVADVFPSSVKLMWANKPRKVDDDEEDLDQWVYMYAINTNNEKESPVNGGHIKNAGSSSSSRGDGTFAVNISMNEDGRLRWKDMTSKNKGRPVAIALDNQVYSAPNVNETISGGNTEISGDFTAEEARDLANILVVGKLPARAEIIEQAIVGASLGSATVSAGLMALAIGFGFVLLFMLVYYAFGGFISILCLFLNIFFIIGSLASFGTSLTLPGIAGIVLTIGMAVDANVIIYERIREELRANANWKEAITNGFKYSYSAIIDANFTTLAVAFILFQYGTGPIKGFATVLMIGVVCSVFAAVLVGRLLFNYWMNKDKEITVWTGSTKNILAAPKLNLVAKRKYAYMISSAIIIAGIASMFTRGFELGVDLQGGRSYTVEFAQDVDTDALTKELNSTFLAYAEGEGAQKGYSDKEGANKITIKTFNTANQVKIITSFMQNVREEGVDSIIQRRVYDASLAYSGAKTSYEDFEKGRQAGSAEDGLFLSAFNKVGPTIADDIRQSAFLASIIALSFIFLYILIRFRRWQFSAGALAALVHDVLFVLGMFSLLKGILPFSLEIDQAFIAAILTVIGYSINDTVVVFDRIRETATNNPGDSIRNIVNVAVNNTLSRTFITSLTTFLVIAILFFFGGDGIRGFAFALLIGVLVGTYSSIFIATPVVVDTLKDVESIKYREPEPEVTEEEENGDGDEKKAEETGA
ncbi:MAG: protein translocase subunit SecDF [Saprospiraceae bacterium]|nr:protein translocase subunit SecDF [Saprospiraceae bacterium]